MKTIGIRARTSRTSIVAHSQRPVIVPIPDLRDKLKARPSPFVAHNNWDGGFVSDDDHVALSAVEFAPAESDCTASSARRCATRAGARETIYFDPEHVTAAIVTCGGLCPGLNDVVQSLANKLHDYGVPEDNVLGVKYGFRGFYDRKARPDVLTRKSVEGIHLRGGTVLGTSRGGADMRRIVKQIDLWGVDMVFVVGGNGGNAGAEVLQEELERCGVDCAVVGVPKSIDNDILLIDKTFGFDTAVEEAQRALLAAKVEASSAFHGIGLVKLMGRQSGFIAMQASMASGLVDICLIPEAPFELHGERGMFAFLEKVLEEKGHAVVCVAEGAGQDILATGEIHTDASGNHVLKDVGPWLKNEMKARFVEADVKYIDPSYIIRSIPPTSGDRIYCKVLAHNAVHAAFAGFTGVTVGLINTHYAYLPIHAVIHAPRRVDPSGRAWNSLRASLGQPNFV